MILAILLIICIILLFLSAFFSGSETALFSLSEPAIEKLRGNERRSKVFFTGLLKNPNNLLTTILLSNTLVNVAFSSIVTIVFLKFFSDIHLNMKLGMLLDTFLITTFLLIFGEFTPKFYALRRTEEFSKRSVIPLYCLMIILKPIVIFFNLFHIWIIRIVKSKVKEEITYSELKTLFELGEQEGVFKGNEEEIINSLFTLSECVVSDIMLPRTKVFFLNGDMEIAEAYRLLLKNPYSRTPVYTTSEEKIDGILYLKDLLIHRKEVSQKIRTILRKPLFVPKGMGLKDMFLEFRKKRVHFAIVVNEFGGIIGIVTMHDILEEIVGNIREEYYKVTTPLYSCISKDEILVDGELKIDDFPANFSPQLPKGDYETIGGFILSNMGRVPKEDEFFIYEDLIFTVVELRERKLEKILIKRRK